MLNVVDRMYIAAQAKWNKFRKEERGDVNIVSIVVLCGIVIALAVIFRNQLKALIESVMSNVTKNATNAVNKVDGTEMVGISGYFNKIASDSNATQEIKDNAANMVDVSHQMLKYKSITYGILVIYLSVIVDVLLLVFGTFLKKSVAQSKIGMCMICSGILGMISTGIILISTILASV